MGKIIVFGVYISNRVKNVGEVQKILTSYGCNIKTRIGLHDVDETSCSTTGLVILEMFGEDSLINEAEEKLLAIDGCEVQRITFNK